jgi:DNA repair photolyase
MIDTLPDRPTKGRGAVSNRSGRFERETRHRVDDGWTVPVESPTPDPAAEATPNDDDELPPLRTTLFVDTARTIIARNDSPDIPFDRSINPYRGCEHGCVYCFARPTHAYYGLSPGLDFETKLFHKPAAPALLEAELRRPGYHPQVMAMGTNTDPYQPIERELRLTRSILEVLAAFNHPVGIVTKSALVARDIDILGAMAERSLSAVAVSITTLDRDLARRLEPRAPTPPRRLETIRQLAKAGIPVGVMSSPMIPGLNDHAMESILEAAAEAGATTAGWTMLRLPLEIADLFKEWLEAHAPDRAKRVLSLVRQTRGGALYKSDWGERMRGVGPVADLLARRFAIACKRLGLNQRRWSLDTSQFAVPPASGDQLRLL